MLVKNYVVPTPFAANGSSASFAAGGSAVNVVSLYFGTGVTFGSGTLTLEVSPDNGTTWVSTGNTWTTATASTFRASVLVFGTLFRLTLSGATSPVLAPVVKLSAVRYGNVDSFVMTANTTFTGTTANAPSVAFLLRGGAEYLFAPANFDLCLQATGTFGSGTVNLQGSPDGGVTWFSYGTLTANGQLVVNAGVTDVLFRVILTGATSPVLAVNVIK